MYVIFLNITLYFGLTSGFISGLDFLLSDKIKDKIKGALESFWLWLEYKRDIKFNIISIKPNILLIITGVFMFFIQLLSFYPIILSNEFSFSSILYIHLLATIGSVIVFNNSQSLSKFYTINKENIFKTNNTFEIIHQSIGFNFNPRVLIPIYLLNKVDYGWFIILIFYSPFILLNTISLIVLLWAFILFSLKSISLIINKFVYKIISYPKGPMIFISTLLTIMSSFLKIINEAIK